MCMFYVFLVNEISFGARPSSKIFKNHIQIHDIYEKAHLIPYEKILISKN